MKYTYNHGAIKDKMSIFGLAAVTMAFALTMATGLFSPAGASHNPAVVTTDLAICEETTFSAVVTDPDGAHLVDNMVLVVDDGTTVQTAVIPADGSEAEVSVGPFAEDTTVSWRVFGGGERDYDDPLWNGHGDPSFSSDVSDYGSENGFDFVVAGTEDDNPFTTWNEVTVEGCDELVVNPLTKDDCKKGGYEDFGFRNQGQCIRFVNTGKDSR